MTERKKITVTCPKCKSKFNYYDSDQRPFCSERCKQVDLGHWFTENYRVPSSEKLTEDDLEKVMENLNPNGQNDH